MHLTCFESVSIITNHFDNTRAYHQNVDAHTSAIQYIADQAKAVIDGICAAATTIRNPTIDASDMYDIAADSPPREEVPIENGEVNNANTNLNTSSSTPPSRSTDPPVNAIHNWYIDKTIIANRDKSKPH